MITSKVNGISNGVLVNNFILVGSHIDDAIMICNEISGKYV